MSATNGGTRRRLERQQQPLYCDRDEKKKKNKVRNFTASVVLVLYCVYCGRGISYYIHYIPQVLAAHLRICMSVWV